MLSILNKQGEEIPLRKLQRVEKDSEVSAGLVLAFTSFDVPENPAHTSVIEEAIIKEPGFEYRIKQLNESKKRKEVVAVSTFFDLTYNQVDEIYGGTRTFSEFVTFISKGTNWTFTSEGISGSKLIPNFGENNTIHLLNELCAVYECEYEIRANNVVHLSKEVGPDNNFIYRYKNNIGTLSKSVSTDNLRTYIVGYAEGGAKVEYTSPNAARFGIIPAPTIREPEYTETQMAEHIARTITDEPELTINISVAELNERQLGERVWLVYEPLGVEMQTRIQSVKLVPYKNGWRTKSVVIGNTKKKTLSDIMADVSVEIDEDRKRNTSRIEQTNDRITLAVEEYTAEFLSAYAKIELTAKEIRMEVAELNEITEAGIANNNSLISQTAKEIRQEVTETITRVDTELGDVNHLISENSSLILQTAKEIRQEVTETVNGSKDEIMETVGLHLTDLAGGISGNTQLIKDTNATIIQTSGLIRQEITETIARVDGDINASNSLVSANSSLIEQTARDIRLEVTEAIILAKGEVSGELKGEIAEDIARLEGGITGNFTLISEAQSAIEQTAKDIRLSVTESVTISTDYTDAQKTEIVTKLNKDIKGVTDSITTVDGKFTGVNNAIAAVDDKTVSLDGRIVTATDNISTVDGKLTVVEGTLSDIDGQVTIIGGKLTGIDGDITSLDGKLTDVNGNLIIINGQIGSVIDDIGTMDVELKSLDGEIVEIKKESAAQLTVLTESITAGVTTSKTYTDALGKAVRSEAAASVVILNGRISSKAETSTVSALGTRIITAETNINAVEGAITSKVSKSDYTGNTITSMINQTYNSVKINAKNIDLTGAVTVLSNISGKLGNITAGNINISEDIKVGSGVHLSGVGQSGVYFADNSQIFSNGGKVHIEALNSMDIVTTQLNLYGRLNLTYVPSIIWGNNKPTAVWG